MSHCETVRWIEDGCLQEEQSESSSFPDSVVGPDELAPMVSSGTDMVRIFFLVVLVSPFLLSSAFAQKEVPIQIPRGLQNQLEKDAGGRSMEPDREVFCEAVDLNKDGQPEYILSQIGGNSSGPMWVYRKVGNKYQQLLDTGAMDHALLNTSHAGYRDLKMTWGGISGGYYKDIYHFNGRKYIRRSRIHRMDRVPD
jgi:hypothetical protein